MKEEMIEIKRKNVLNIYEAARETGAGGIMIVLETLFGKETFKPKDVTERIKTFENACRELEERGDDVLVRQYYSVLDTAIVDANLDAYLKLRIICAALNEGQEPKLTKDEVRWYPWFWLYTQDEINGMDEQDKKDRHLISTGDYKTGYEGFGYARSHNVPSFMSANINSRLCLKSEALAAYCGKQFIDFWADLCLITK